MASDLARDPLASEFLRYLEVERNASPRTLNAYRAAFAAFRSQRDSPPAWECCVADDFRDYLFALMKKGQARSYVRLQFSAFRTFYRFLVERKNFAKDPVRELQLPKAEKKLPLVLTRKQMDDIREKYTSEMLELAKSVKTEPQPDPSTIYDHTYFGQKGKYW